MIQGVLLACALTGQQVDLTACTTIDVSPPLASIQECQSGGDYVMSIYSQFLSQNPNEVQAIASEIGSPTFKLIVHCMPIGTDT